MSERCGWAKNDLSIAYHDTEWGVPSHDDTRLYEFLVLEGAQAGLSWDTILRKREAYREAFDGFDIGKVAKFTPSRVEKLMKNEGIVRNRAKIESSVTNARLVLAVQAEFGSLDRFIWGFAEGGVARVNKWKSLSQLPASTPASDAMSKSLKKRGFKFVGSTICYAYMQAVGMVNDHLVTCPRHAQVAG